MRRIDEQYLRDAVLRHRGGWPWLREQGHAVNRKRVQRLMRVMGMEAIYPRPRTTRRGAGHRIYPYLLRNVAIARPDQVWSTDITYVPLRHGLHVPGGGDRLVQPLRAGVASCRTRWTGSFCLEALDEALARRHGRRSSTRDQGAQFTSHGLHRPLGSVRASRSAWTAAAGRWTTCSSSGCGGA